MESANPTSDPDIRYSDRSTINVNGRTVEHLGDVLDMNQHRQFMSEIDTKPKGKFRRAENGDVIVPIDNMLVYTDFSKSDPEISKIIRFETDDYTLIDAATSTIFDQERRGLDYEQTRRIVEDFIGEGNLVSYETSDFGEAERYDRRAKRGKSRSDSYHAEQQQRRRSFHFGTEEDGEYGEHVDTESRVLSERDTSLDPRTLLSNALERLTKNGASFNRMKRWFDSYDKKRNGST